MIGHIRAKQWMNVQRAKWGWVCCIISRTTFPIVSGFTLECSSVSYNLKLFFYLKELFKHFPRQQRSLSIKAKEKASHLLRMRANKKLVQQQLVEQTGNVILLKDLTNIAIALKRGKSRNDLDVAVKSLMERYGKTWTQHLRMVHVHCQHKFECSSRDHVLFTREGRYLIRPPLGPVKVSWLEGWPHFRGEFVSFQSGLNTGVATFQRSWLEGGRKPWIEHGKIHWVHVHCRALALWSYQMKLIKLWAYTLNRINCYLITDSPLYKGFLNNLWMRDNLSKCWVLSCVHYTLFCVVALFYIVLFRGGGSWLALRELSKQD